MEEAGDFSIMQTFTSLPHLFERCRAKAIFCLFSQAWFAGGTKMHSGLCSMENHGHMHISLVQSSMNMQRDYFHWEADVLHTAFELCKQIRV